MFFLFIMGAQVVTAIFPSVLKAAVAQSVLAFTLPVPPSNMKLVPVKQNKPRS